jgi:CRISPR-associated protein Cmr2
VDVAVDWTDLLLAYLHDPPDKALSIRGHVSRARDNAQIAVGDHVSTSTLKDAVSLVDPLASIIERFPMPKAGEEGKWAVGPENDKLLVVHPLSAVKQPLSVPMLNDELTRNEGARLREVVSSLTGEGDQHIRNRLLAVWRLWPDDLATHIDPCLALLPADTRTPDHTIWNHLDITAAFKAAGSEGRGVALIAFALGPVQRFIEAARSIRDLWSGSMMLSWLAFRSMLPVVEELGPTALVYPALRGNPLLDLWLADAQRLGSKVLLPDVRRRKMPLLPHRFLAVVPWGTDGAAAHALADECRGAFAHAWQEMASGVKQRVQQSLDSLSPGWEKRWDSQISEYFSASTAVVPLGGSGESVDARLARLLANEDSFGTAFNDAEAVRELARSIPGSDRPNYAQGHAGRWQYQVELVGRLLASQRSIRHVPMPAANSHADERFPPKCTLLGSFEQVGPDDLRQSKQFWDKVASQDGLNVDGVRIRPGEALCAIALVKRFVGPAFLCEQLKLSTDDLRFHDTWTIAAAEWLDCAKKHGIRIGPGHIHLWNGHWLHWSRTNQDLSDADECPPDMLARIQSARKSDKCGAPPVYYAVLKLDGDDLGGWLRGGKSLKVREAMHPDLVRYYEGLGERAKAGLDAKRPVGPALHAAISTALSNFAIHVVPAVVEKHHGTVIYSGGDDSLILLPVSTALACANELRQAYMSDWYPADGQKYLMMGSRATLSGGLVAVHAKDDLRLALGDARTAEKKAKDAGKDALCIAIRRRSGEHTSAICPWSFAPTVAGWSEQFRIGASDRWVYHLYAIRKTLEHLPGDAIKAEMRRQINRAESPTPDLIPPDQVAEAYDAFRYSSVQGEVGMRPRFESAEESFKHFLTICHTASFLARGRDA